MKTDGETVEMITLSGHEYLYNCQMICSSNGSICWIDCHGTYLDIFICNPATRDVLLLPKSRLHDEDPSFGVGFGPGINEYKVFWFFYARRPYQGISYQCEEYSSRSGSWKRIGCVAHSPTSWKHVSIKGTVYWFITSSEKEALYPSSILAVDMEETFRTIDLPKLVPEYSFLVELEGCLSLIALHVDNVHRFESSMQ